MEELIKQITDKAEELNCLTKELEFIRNGNEISKGKVGMKLEDGFYVIYEDNEATETISNFINAYQRYEYLTRN